MKNVIAFLRKKLAEQRAYLKEYKHLQKTGLDDSYESKLFFKEIIEKTKDNIESLKTVIKMLQNE